MVTLAAKIGARGPDWASEDRRSGVGRRRFWVWRGLLARIEAILTPAARTSSGNTDRSGKYY